MQTNGLNIALIGCGFFGVQLASAFDNAQANLIAVTDINPSLAQKLAEQYGSQAFFSVEEMLTEAKPDLVVIATPNYAHYSPAILALNAGRSEERRVGKECLRLCRSRWSPYH